MLFNGYIPELLFEKRCEMQKKVNCLMKKVNCLMGRFACEDPFDMIFSFVTVNQIVHISDVCIFSSCSLCCFLRNLI